MKEKMLTIGLLFLLLFSGTMIVNAEKPLVAVLPFEEGRVGWNGLNRDTLNGITQMVTDRLVEEDNIRVIERSRISDIINEQDFGQSGRVDPSTAAEIGRILGVDALILGTVTRMEVGNQGGISFGPLTVSSVKAEIVITGRVVDASSAEIKESFEGKGEASDESIGISDLKGFSFGSKSFSDSVLGESIQQAVKEFTENIISNPDKLLKGGTEIRGIVVKVIGDKLIIDIGSRDKVRNKMLGEVIRMVEVEGLDEDVSFPIGKVQVYSVNETTAILKMLDTEEIPQEGDFVKLSSSR